VVSHAGATFAFPQQQQQTSQRFTGEYLTASCTAFGMLGPFSGAAWSRGQGAEYLQEGG
jgi:hypothetical protein